MNISIYKERRDQLVERIKANKKPDQSGIIFLIAAFEKKQSRFIQESSFYYFTGIQEPGAMIVIDLEGKSTLFIPNTGNERAQWVHAELPLIQDNAAALGFDYIKELGDKIETYMFSPLFSSASIKNILTTIEKVTHLHGTIFSLNSSNSLYYVEQKQALSRVASFARLDENKIEDISPIVATMRRKKNMRELELLYQAVEITQMAHQAAAQVIAPNITEAEVQATLEYVMTGSNSTIAFPTIVGSGKNGAILHYTTNSSTLQPSQLVVVDIGAQYENYCADLTRTYPVNRQFTKRQEELYQLVLDTQEYIASIAKAGMWLSYKEKPDQSLHHLAKAYLQEKGYGQYFIHGIGHFLGLDVHDVGDSAQPLQSGDVITIEPGLYLPDENIGIRIEDNYWIVEEEAVCLSEQLPKKMDDICEFMKTE